MVEYDEAVTLPLDQDTAAFHAPAWFEAPSPSGPMRLCTFGRHVRHAVDAAIALQELAPLLDALDDWARIDAAWRWIEPGACPLAPETHVWVAWHAADDEGDGAHANRGDAAVRLELPWALLRRLPPAPEALGRRMRWPALPSVAIVSRMWLDADELPMMEVGGAVVLPASVQPGWQGLLRAAAERAGVDNGVALALAFPAPPRLASIASTDATMPARPTDTSVACELRMAAAHTVSADRLAGWFTGETIEVASRAGLWCLAGAEPRCIATGRLQSWGAGWALALEHVAQGIAHPTPKH